MREDGMFEGRIFAVGSSYMFSDYYYFEENKVFIENVITWLLATMKLDVIVDVEPHVYVEEPLELKIHIINRGTRTIHSIQIQLLYSSPVMLLNSTAYLEVPLLAPREDFYCVFILKSDTAGQYFVELIVFSPEYPETIDLWVPLTFEEKPYLIWIAVAVMLVVIVAIISVKRRSQ